MTPQDFTCIALGGSVALLTIVWTVAQILSIRRRCRRHRHEAEQTRSQYLIKK